MYLTTLLWTKIKQNLQQQKNEKTQQKPTMISNTVKKSIWKFWWEKPRKPRVAEKKFNITSLSRIDMNEQYWNLTKWKIHKMMYCNKYTYLQKIQENGRVQWPRTTMAVFTRTLALWVVPYCLFWIACSFPRWISRFFWFLSQILKLTNYSRQGIRTPRCAEI